MLERRPIYEMKESVVTKLTLPNARVEYRKVTAQKDFICNIRQNDVKANNHKSSITVNEIMKLKIVILFSKISLSPVTGFESFMNLISFHMKEINISMEKDFLRIIFSHISHSYCTASVKINHKIPHNFSSNISGKITSTSETNLMMTLQLLLLSVWQLPH